MAVAAQRVYEMQQKQRPAMESWASAIYNRQKWEPAEKCQEQLLETQDTVGSPMPKEEAMLC